MVRFNRKKEYFEEVVGETGAKDIETMDGENPAGNEEVQDAAEKVNKANEERAEAEAKLDNAKDDTTAASQDLTKANQNVAEEQANLQSVTNDATTKAVKENVYEQTRNDATANFVDDSIKGEVNDMRNNVNNPESSVEGVAEVRASVGGDLEKTKTQLKARNSYLSQMYDRIRRFFSGSSSKGMPNVEDDFLKDPKNRTEIQNQHKFSSEMMKELGGDGYDAPTESDLKSAKAYDAYKAKARVKISAQLQDIDLEKMPSSMDEYKKQFKENFKDDPEMQRFIDRNIPSDADIDRASERAEKVTKDQMQKEGGLKDRDAGNDKTMFEKVIKAVVMLGLGFAAFAAFSALQNMLNGLSVNNSGCMLVQGKKGKVTRTPVPINVQSDGGCASGTIGNLEKYPGIQLYDLGATSATGPISIGQLNYPYSGFCGCVPSGGDLSTLCKDPSLKNYPECIAYNQKNSESMTVDMGDSCSNVTLKPIPSPSDIEVPRCDLNASAKNTTDLKQYVFKNQSALGAVLAAVRGAFNSASKALWKILLPILIGVGAIVLIIIIFKVIIPAIQKGENRGEGEGEGVDVNLNVEGKVDGKDADKFSGGKTKLNFKYNGNYNGNPKPKKLKWGY
jgi:hypothetical protein